MNKKLPTDAYFSPKAYWMIVATVVNPLSPSFFSSFVSDCLASETKPAASMKAAAD